jgi:hypothetical protein
VTRAPRYLSYAILVLSGLYAFFALLTALAMGALLQGGSLQITFQVVAIVLLPLGQIILVARRDYIASIAVAIIGYGVFILSVS